MEKLYKQVTAYLYCIACLFVMASCHSTLSYNDAIQKNISRADDPDMHDDARFIADAGSYNLLATQMAHEAVESGYSASVVNLAKETLEEQEEMQKELKKIARQAKMVLPAEMSEEHEKMLSELKAAGRDTFDKTYIRLLSEVNTDNRRKFETMATDAGNEDIRAFAARQIGHFDKYQDQLRTVDAELLRTY